MARNAAPFLARKCPLQPHRHTQTSTSAERTPPVSRPTQHPGPRPTQYEHSLAYLGTAVHGKQRHPYHDDDHDDVHGKQPRRATRGDSDTGPEPPPFNTGQGPCSEGRPKTPTRKYKPNAIGIARNVGIVTLCNVSVRQTRGAQPFKLPPPGPNNNPMPRQRPPRREQSCLPAQDQFLPIQRAHPQTRQ